MPLSAAAFHLHGAHAVLVVHHAAADGEVDPAGQFGELLLEPGDLCVHAATCTCRGTPRGNADREHADSCAERWGGSTMVRWSLGGPKDSQRSSSPQSPSHGSRARSQLCAGSEAAPIS